MSTFHESSTKYVEWKIQNFFNRPKRKNYHLNSPVFSESGAMWHLRIYPNGETEECTSFRYVGMYLCKRKCGTRYTVSYRIGIKKVDGFEFRYHEFENTFKGRDNVWGTSGFIEISKLKRTWNVIDNDGSLTVFCSIRVLDDPYLFLLNCFKLRTRSEPSQTSSPTATTLEASTQTTLPDTNLEDASQTPLQDTTSEVPSETSSPNSITGEFSVQSSSLKSMLSLVEDFKNIYNSKLYTDVVFSVKGENFPVHKSVLAARSPVFASMFEHEFAEKSSGKVEISDCDPDLFNQFLLFLYIGKIDGMSSSKAVHLYMIADKYNVEELKEECVRCMVGDVSIDSFCDVIHLAVLHNDSDLPGSCH